MESFEEFFLWCDRQGLQSDRHIASAFGRTPQTVRNWRKSRPRARTGAPPLHLALSCVGYEAARQETGELVPPINQMAMSFFEAWRRYHGLDTLEATGEAFGLTRQAIHNWCKRKRLPRWLPLACIGYERRAASRAAAAAVPVVEAA